jgi:hypothetical protein
VTVDGALHRGVRHGSSHTHQHDIAATWTCGLEDHTQGVGGGDGRCGDDEEESEKEPAA